MIKQAKLNIVLSVSFALMATGCASIIDPSKSVEVKRVNVADSYLNEPTKVEQNTTEPKSKELTKDENTFERVHNLKNGQSLTLEVDLSKQFDSNKMYQVSVNSLPLNDFIHYALGELLEVSYLIEPSIKAKNTPVTLQLKEQVTAQRLFQLVQEVFLQNKVTITLNDGIFYIFPEDPKGSKSDVAFGFGREANSVPNVASDIIQLVPTKYGVSTGLRSAVAGLVDAQVSIDPSQGLVTIKGKREQILRAISLIHLIDSAAMNKKALALMTFNYIDSQTFITKAKELLELEGISVANTRSTSSSVNFIPIEHLGQVVVFASADEIIDRVEYWQKQLDKPATGAEQSFYIYHPKYARASDIGQSLAPLLGGSFSSNKSKTATAPSTASTSDTAPKPAATSAANTVQSIEGDGIRLVVDERANALIFYSSGQYYQELQPILNQLDIMPKQVMMEVVIAEVKLTGSFSKGVQYAIQSGAATGRTENINFNTAGKGAFTYSIVGLPGNISVNLSQSDGLVNVLSRPTLLVRDGVAASISVGDDIPTIGSTTTNPLNSERETTTIEYRKTGVDLTVTPTINAQGTVIMTISQSISNVSDTTGASDNPSFFERTLNTEVVAGNGQTVMLGGLISENKSNGASSVPFFGSLPVLGHLFRSDTSSSDKTELVILVTPKIVQNTDDWQRVKQSFIQGLENLTF
ncbi:secretin N-terminal domain-containing protein [Pseudoalteromonas distincta]|uniref:secretin N-terminal domain-containing protein n=1 Tax=Pseudoalteromonas distincta TaxID=77608 RepID=UPI001869DF5A|nr:secretin N-terminal domain-containing protein [Pseudoalteromonas distincta]MBE3672537.1 general secretion pathway protein D [Pseudoalteromonas distincta KMM 3548]MDC3212126.1 type II secretory pathway protein [Pseudoalteromonas distincta]